MDLLGYSSLLVAVTCFAIGISVLARNVRNILFIAFTSVTTAISIWALAFSLEKIWADYGFYRLHLFFNVILPPICLIFIRLLVRIHDRLSSWILRFSIVTAFTLSLAILFRFETIVWVKQLIYYAPVCIVFQTLELMWIDYRLKQGLQRLPKIPTVGLGRKNLIYGGALVVLALTAMDHVPWVGDIVPVIGNLILMAYVFFLSQAITQQRLLNINAVISRFLVLLFLALIITAVYSLFAVWVQDSFGLFLLNSFIVSFVILMLLEPLQKMVSYFNQILLSQKHRRLQSVLREAQRNLTGIVDLPSLFQEILSTVDQTLQPQSAALYVLRSDGTKYRRIKTLGRDSQADHGVSSKVREVLVNHPILQYIEDSAKRGRFPVLLDQILESEIDRSASKSQRREFAQLIEGLKALNSNLLIPLYSSGKVLGFLTSYVPSPPEPWGNNWGLLPIIYPYFEQAAQTMQSMEVYVRQREKERLAALGEMAAGLAHEIRNPLGAIKGAAQFLDPSADRPESKFLKIIIEETDRLNQVVTQFLDYSKPAVTEFQLINVSRLAEKTVEHMKPGIRPGIVVEFECSRFPATVMASAEQIRQVLINLLQNAERALGEKQSGMIRVTVSVEGDQKNGEVWLIVEDTGSGIKKENMDKLFIPFFTTTPSGTGLGLSISQKIIEAHRGRIEIASEEGRFTRVSVILPFAKE